MILSIFPIYLPPFTQTKSFRKTGDRTHLCFAEAFLSVPFLTGSSDETGAVLVNYLLPTHKAYQKRRRMPAFSFHFLWKSPPRSLAKSA